MLLIDIFQIIGSLATAVALIYSIYQFKRIRKSEQIKTFIEAIENLWFNMPKTSISWTSEESRRNKQIEFFNYLNKCESLALLRITNELKTEILVTEIKKQIKGIYNYLVITIPLFTPKEFEEAYPYMSQIYNEDIQTRKIFHYEKKSDGMDNILKQIMISYLVFFAYSYMQRNSFSEYLSLAILD